MKRNIMILLGLSAVLVTAACGASEIIDPTRVPTQAGQSEPTQPSTPTKQSEPTQAPDASGQGDTSSGYATIDQLAASLHTAGAVTETGGDVSQPFIDVPGQILLVNGVDVQVFEFSSAAAAADLAAQVSPDGSSVGTTMIMWVEPPHYFLSGRLIVLYVGENNDTLVMLAQALGPQFAGR